ncbi:hypothetical protein [Albidovulum sp.]|jgi:hypothetical protein|uniref:hypothetical protein n=1 Tax=Albidovulum sp. TaxID=1872424 RepID=UPI0039B8CC36
MTDLIEKARLGRTNALSHISGEDRLGRAGLRAGRHAVPFAFVSSRAKLGGRTNFG